MVNLINTGDASSDETIFMANYQQEVSARHNLPFSVGFGAGYRLGKHRIHFSTEWYDKVDRYDILDAEDFIGQSSGETFSNQVDSELKSVLNYGFGFEYYISEKIRHNDTKAVAPFIMAAIQYDRLVESSTK